MTTAPTANLFDVLSQRGLIAQWTDEQIRQRLTRPVTAYCGFDPTADSLHVGSLVPIMGLAWLQRCGHRPIVLIGGATGLVGDPSGKTEARKMLSRQEVDRNAQAIARQIARFIRLASASSNAPADLPAPAAADLPPDAPDALLLNNADWLASKTWLDMLREVGAHFSVNRMLSMESVRGRLDAGGISYLEFSYMVMQAYDFVHLYQHHGCTLQLGGQDQWGNIVMGIELGRRMANADLAGITLPLVTKADGSKFGKSEAGNVWLDPQRTSPYQFYQFWRNTADADVGRFLAYFTFLPMDEVHRLAALEGQAINQAKEVLAYEVTKLVHGQAEADAARDSARKAFGAERDVTGEAIPHATLDRSELRDGAGLLTLMVRAGLAPSNSEARRLVQSGGVHLHDEQVKDPTRRLTEQDVRDGYILIRVGKKRLFRYDVG
ncbi:MAG TPA: tyrosine--tRNA ligase [Phycisphaeraceae bacterium]